MKKFVFVGLGLVLGTSMAWADGDASKGEQTAKQCMACHSLTDASNRVGPSLFGIYGRKPGIAEGYSYSEPFKKYATTADVWNDATLDVWLKEPNHDIPGTKMTFAGIKDDAVRADLIAFLKTKK